ncbi:homoserine kinase [Shewanella surugensis]|uniref:Homoserine kinase n=1 Tax=Shewanella surugensis TaxID=212020 RepID=A0ABT0L675_9GAMM|nr:homoserine kinase [Shewanella surugensis]MCL1123069.1 homoserine kinase [Shewanella surugensis]
MSVKVYAPASIANISVGFDTLGAALAPIDGSLLGDTVSIEAAVEGMSLEVMGTWANKLPQDPAENIVYQCAEFFIAQLADKGVSSTGIKLTLHKNLPVGSGLGSSASSVVAALYALNEYFENPFSEQHLLLLMGKFEGQISGSVHYDNVAPCYLGQMQLILNGNTQVCDAIPNFNHWYWVMSYSGVSLSTAKMRQLLPEQYDKSTAIEFGRHLSAFVHASYKQDEALAIEVLKDVLAEPYRAGSIPGYLEAKAELTKMGMLATGISGSGPTLFSITSSLEKAQQAQAWLNTHYLKDENGFSHICQVDPKGARRI